MAITPCTCKNTYQDKKYGNKKRVMNPTQEKARDGNVKVRCTVCENIKEVKK